MTDTKPTPTITFPTSIEHENELVTNAVLQLLAVGWVKLMRRLTTKGGTK
jgi:hypothetical protein